MSAKPARKTAPPIGDAKVRKLFASYPATLRNRLMALRALIFETAATLHDVGQLNETLKWGQPSYLTTQTKSGSTIRIDQLKDGSGYAMYVHCQTNLIATFRELYPTQMTYAGNRSILFGVDDKLPQRALRHCIGLALTYHARQKPKQKSKIASAIKTPKRRARPS